MVSRLLKSDKIDTQFDDKNSLVINRTVSPISLDEFLEYIKANISLWESYNVIWDLSYIDYSNTDTQSIRAFIARSTPLTKRRAGLKTALVCCDDLSFGMTRMLEQLSSQEYAFTMHTFKNMEKAKEWIFSET